MVFHWLSLGVGIGLGMALGVAGDWQIGARFRKRAEMRALTKEYSTLAGSYLTCRIKDDATHDATGATVEIAWNAQDALLEASSFDRNGYPEWHSYIRMSREYAGTGVGHFNNSNSIHGGTQQIVYSRQTRSFTVLRTGIADREGAYCWKLKE
jgi:hypothetical protein